MHPPERAQTLGHAGSRLRGPPGSVCAAKSNTTMGPTQAHQRDTHTISQIPGRQLPDPHPTERQCKESRPTAPDPSVGDLPALCNTADHQWAMAPEYLLPPLDCVTGSTGDPPNPGHMRSTGDLGAVHVTRQPNQNNAPAASSIQDWAPSAGDAPHPAPGTHSDSCLPEFMQRIQYPSIHQENGDGPGEWEQDDGLIHEAANQAARSPSISQRKGYEGWPFPTLQIPQATARLYDIARAANTPNHCGPRPFIPTDLAIDQWKASTTGHQDDDMILDGIQFGFPIQYQGPPILQPPTQYNHPSALNHGGVIEEYIEKETALGALYGPFDSPPFIPWMCTSPMMTREKQDSVERRVIVDLSYPEGGVNKFIQPHVFNGRPARHNLPTVDQAVLQIAKACPGDVHLAVVDLSRAYRQFPVPPTDWPLLGIQFKGKYYWDGRIPFGARMSSFAMQSVAQFITRALKVKHIDTFMYLDDIIIVSSSKQQAERQYRDTLTYLEGLGLQVASKKLQPLARSVTWLGICIDLDANQISIPPAKLHLIKRCLAAAARQPRITKRHLQSLLGYINHLSKVVRAARIFIGRMLAALRAAEGDVVTVTPHIKADLGWFARYLDKENAKAIIPHDRTVLRIWADSSLHGGGATDGASYYAYVYPKAMAGAHHITQLEAINLLGAVRLFVTNSHAGGSIEIYCDNMASVSAYSSGRARDSVLAACTRAMWFKAAATQTTLSFSHLPGEGMVLPDALSRVHIDSTMRRRAMAMVKTMALTQASPNRAHFAYKDFL